MRSLTTRPRDRLRDLREEAERRGRRLLRPTNAITGILFLIAMYGIWSRLAGGMDEMRALVLVIAPAGAAMALLRPAWLLLVLLALPPDLLESVTPRLLLIAVLATLVAMVARHNRIHLGPSSGVWALATLLALAMLFQADISGDGANVADGLLKLLQYYLALALLAYNAVRLRAVTIRAIATALLVGALVTAVLSVVGGPLSGSLADSRNAAYLTGMGMLVAFGRLVLARRQDGTYEPVLANFLIAGFLGYVTAGMLVRATWVSILIAFVLMAIWTEQTRWLVAIPMITALILVVPVSRERVVPDDLGGDTTLAEYTTGRWELWEALSEESAEGMPFGQGWGHWWSMTPRALFGTCSFVPEARVQLDPGECSQDYVYPHNDWLFLSVDLGLVGPALLTLFWLQLARAHRRLAKRPGPTRDAAVVLVGAATIFLLVQLVDNGIALQPVAERFFIVAGAVFGMHAAMTQDLHIDPDAAGDQPPAIA